MQRNGLLTFRNSRFEITLARCTRLLVAYQEYGQQLCIVVLMTTYFGLFAFDVGLRTVEEYVVACRERLPKARTRRILLSRTRREPP